jgi:hypothetical protein
MYTTYVCIGSDSWTRYEYCYTERNHTSRLSCGTVFPLISRLLHPPKGYLLRVIGLFRMNG